MEAVLDRAMADAVALQGAGFHGVMVENFSDVPFFGGAVPPETVATMTTAANAIIAEVDVPVGINVLRNDARAALSIAAVTGARFIRVNVHTGSMYTDQGLLHGRAAETLRARAALEADIAILADVHVKHAVAPAGASLADSASDAWHRGLADGLVVSGAGTGSPTESDDVTEVKRAVSEASVLVGSGVTAETVATWLAACDGVIVGSSVMYDGRPGMGVDVERARRFVGAAAG